MKQGLSLKVIIWLILLCAGLTVKSASAFDAAEFWAEPVGLAFDTVVLENGEEGDVVWQSMVYTSEIYQGEPMRIFAYYAHPKSPGRYPAVVDIHGGGGGADLNNAKTFAGAGYACLSYDWHTCGDPVQPVWHPGDPLPSEKYTRYGNLRYTDWAKHFSETGPDNDWKRPVLYRAVTAGRRALTWLSQRPEVDPERLGVEGHSWGGFLTQLICGIDPRIKAAVASASAGAWISRYNKGIEGHLAYLTPWQVFQWSRRYDPASFADNIKSSLLVHIAAADFFGSIDTLADYWLLVPGQKSLQIIPASSHSSGDLRNRIAWMDHWFKGGPAFPEIKEVKIEPDKNGLWNVRVTATGPVEITAANVNWTTSPCDWNKRTWAQRLLVRDGDAWTGTFATVNAGTTLRAFVSVRDANNNLVSCIPLIREITQAVQLPSVVAGTTLSIAKTGRSPLKFQDAWSKARRIGPVAPRPEVIGETDFQMDALWDESALYLRLEVTDRTPWQTRPDKAAWWDGDSVQVRLRTDKPDARSSQAGEPRVLHLGWYPDEKGKLTVDAVAGKQFQDRKADVSPVTGSVVVNKDSGYTLIVRIPWEFVDNTFKPLPGCLFRLAVMVNYCDPVSGERLDSVDFNGAASFGNSDDWGFVKLTTE